MKKPISWFHADKDQPRKHFPENEIADLAKTFKTEDIIHPIEVDTTGKIVVGERRFRAAKLAGYKELELGKHFVINSRGMSPYERLRRQIVENIHHSSLSGGATTMDPYDEARAFDKMMKLRNSVPGTGTSKYTVTDLSRDIGVPDTTIHQALALLDEPKFVEQAITEKKIPKTLFFDAKVIKDPKLQQIVKKRIAKGEIETSRDVRALATQIKENPSKGLQIVSRNFDERSGGANAIINAASNTSLILSRNPIGEMNLPSDIAMVKTYVRKLEKDCAKYLEN